MSAINGTGYQVEVLNEELGYQMESDGYPSIAAAQTALDLITPDGKIRRVYESLEGFN